MAKGQAQEIKKLRNAYTSIYNEKQELENKYSILQNKLDELEAKISLGVQDSSMILTPEKFNEISEMCEVVVNDADSKKDLLEEMVKYMSFFKDRILKYYPYNQDLFTEDARIDIMSKVCSYSNATIVCAITGLRVTKIITDKDGIKIPKIGLRKNSIFMPWLIEDRVKNVKEGGQLVHFATTMINYGHQLNINCIKPEEEIFRKKDWCNLARIARIIDFAKSKETLLKYTIINTDSISDLIEARNGAWKEILICVIALLFVIIGGSAALMYNNCENFRRNVDDLFNYYSESFSDSDVQNIVGD